MHRLRSRWFASVLAVGLMLSILGSAIGPAARALDQSGRSSYAEWVENRLQGMQGDALEVALGVADRAEAASLEEFVDVFVASYAAHSAQNGRQVETHLRQVVVRQLFLSYLQRCVLQMSWGGLSSRLFAATASTAGSTILPRVHAYLEASAHRIARVVSLSRHVLTGRPISVSPLSRLWSAQPLGP